MVNLWWLKKQVIYFLIGLLFFGFECSAAKAETLAPQAHIKKTTKKKIARAETLNQNEKINLEDPEEDAEKHEQMLRNIQLAENQSQHSSASAKSPGPANSVMAPFLETETEFQNPADPPPPQRKNSSTKSVAFELPVDTKPALKMPTEMGGFGVLIIPSETRAQAAASQARAAASQARRTASVQQPPVRIQLQRVVAAPVPTPSRKPARVHAHRSQVKKHLVVSQKKKSFSRKVAVYKKPGSSK